MKILHLYPENEPLVAGHVRMLQQTDSTDNAVDGAPAELQRAGDRLPDIVHIHGCWQYGVVRQALGYHRQGVRIVFTPHGGLEPWMVKERRLSEKLAKTLLWQRRLAEYSYVVIAQGKMEAEALSALGWNPRIEVIRNAVITNSITQAAMVKATYEVYRKVMDSNTRELMGTASQQLLAMLLKAGITGDRRWVAGQPADIDQTEWRRLLVYADHENVRTVVDSGTHVLGLRQPYIETNTIKSYLPTDYKLPKVEAHDVTGIVSEMSRGHVTLRHLVELDRALRRNDVEDDWLQEALEEARLMKYFRRLLQVLTEQTGLDEGFLPARPLDDRGTQKIRNMLTNHLRI
ncbi:MAG: glycosyltransferase [Prevotella sp.]|nr:glycosyltransferase [Prevotella sp.]